MKLRPEFEMIALCLFAVALILIAVCLGGCATRPVYVPQACPKVTIAPEHHYPVQDLHAGDKPDKVMKAYVATVQGQRDYIGYLKQKFKPYSEDE
jgi:hypothetical protein